MDYLAKYSPQTSIFHNFEVASDLSPEDRAFKTWEKLLSAKRSHEGLFLVKFCCIFSTCRTKPVSLFAQYVIKSSPEMPSELGSVLGHVKTQLKKQVGFLVIKNTIQPIAQLVEKGLPHTTVA